MLIAWLQYNEEKLTKKLTRFGKGVFDQSNPIHSIILIEEYFKRIRFPTRLIVINNDLSENGKIAENAVALAKKMGSKGIYKEVITDILKFIR